jgi:hypothetical protein
MNYLPLGAGRARSQTQVIGLSWGISDVVMLPDAQSFLCGTASGAHSTFGVEEKGEYAEETSVKPVRTPWVTEKVQTLWNRL